MKTKLPLWAPATLLLLIVSLAAVHAQPVPKRAPAMDPATGLPASGSTPAMDPNTGLPLPQPEPQWIDPNWTDPNLVLTNVMYDNLPLVEVTRILRERFKDYFDILPLPHGNMDYSGITIQLQMKNVKASDVFNAMNLVFENDHLPLRWQLMMNGSHPTVLLRQLPELTPPVPESKRMIFFVGDLTGDPKSGGMTIKQIGQIISDVWQRAYGQSGTVEFYEPAQLVIVSGTPEQIEFIARTVDALKQKADLARDQAKSTDTSAKSGPAASGAAAPK